MITADSTVGIFCYSEDSNFFDHFFGPVWNIKLTQDIHSSRNACIHFPYPYTPRVEQFFETYLDKFDSVLVVITELHEFAFNFCKKYDDKKVTYMIAGQLNFPLEHSCVYTYMDWFKSTSDVYCLFPDYLKDLKSGVKQYKFDALLGRSKPNRDYAFNFIQQNLNTAGIVKYSRDQRKIDFNDTSQWETSIPKVVTDGITFTVETVDYFGHNVRLSHLIPVGIYNQTNFSLVTETNTSNNFIFLTEKTAKCLIAKRMFILLGNRYSLRFLKDLGFKTFDVVVDESYDSIEDQNLRFEQAMLQLKKLATMDQHYLLDRVEPIVAHNQQLILNTDWSNTDDVTAAMQNWLGSCPCFRT